MNQSLPSCDLVSATEEGHFVISTFRIVIFVLLLCCAFGSASADPVDDYIRAQMRELHIPGTLPCGCS